MFYGFYFKLLCHLAYKLRTN